MNAQAKHNYRDLLYNRQFVVGPRIPKSLKLWQHASFNGVGIICAHPNLNLDGVSIVDREAVCLGQMIDPGKPSDDGRRVLERIVKLASNFETFETATAEVGGRWLGPEPNLAL